ncbi:hypothetical protein AB0F17_07610 [Nonomuraea sp. NPDC026600]|uniref:hypothetical protein n=1 Tax=Nonomuraea sp. NPDC026600 TaxID=3155363 RepID=UPI0033F535EA
MTSDELKVPSQRADHANDEDEREDNPSREHLDGRASGGGYGPADDFRTDALSEGDDLRANDTPTADLTRDDKNRHHEPYAPTGGDMLADPEPSLGADPAHAEPESEYDDEQGDEQDDEQNDVRELVAVDGAPSHAAPPESVILFDQDPAEVQARWRELQTSFVDDPGDSVQRAEGLVDEVVEALTSSLTARTGELRDRWKGAGDTEQLRLALREYRVVLERLLTLSAHESGSAHETR